LYNLSCLVFHDNRSWIGLFGKIGKLVPLIEVQTIQNSPDGSGWMFCVGIVGLFTEWNVKNARHLGDAIHKRTAGLSITTKQQTVRS